MKDPGQAMAAFGKALEIDPNCQVKLSNQSEGLQELYLSLLFFPL